MAGSAAAREMVFVLRQEIAKIEGRPVERLEQARPAAAGTEAPLILRRNGMATLELFETGAPSLDAALGGGLPLAALTEIHAAETRNAGAVAGFALALASRILGKQDLPLLWVGTSEIVREAGFPHPPGLAERFGIPSERLLISQAPKLLDALWIAEEAARLTALGAVVLELRGNPQKLDLVTTRRLHRRAQDAGRPVFLLRQAGEAEPTAAPVRLVVGPAPAGKRRILSGALAGSIGPPAFAVAIHKSRLSMPAEFTLEWNADERAFHEREVGQRRTPHTRPVVPLSGDGADQAPAAGQVVALKGAA
jgi:protein ImuA